MKNQKLKTLLTLCLFLQLAFTNAQISFTVDPNMLSGGTSGYNDCVLDMNGDHLDDVVRVGSNAVYIDYQHADGTYSAAQFPMSIINAPTWSIAGGDLNADGFNDLLFGNGTAVSFLMSNSTGTDYEEIAHPEYIFSQRSTMADIDNDGDLDAFVCHDIDLSHPYRNDGTGNMVLDQSLIETIDQPGNYAAIWVDYDNDGDSDLYITKCRGGAAPGDPFRTNRLYQNNGDGTYTEVGEQANMDDNAQSWATVFEDFDNDGDFDAFIVNHDFQNRFMLNNGDGTFTDIIDQTGISPNDLGAWENASGDFDNNGYIDILSEMNNSLYLNNGDLTFTAASGINVNGGGIGDLNNDGFLDVVRSGVPFINDGNDNNWVKINTEGLISNKNGIGARVEIHGDWGVQIREVRSGQSFSPMSSLAIHFGIGTSTSIDQIVIKWPSGIITTLADPAINTTHFMLEAQCLLANVDLTVDGNMAICPGETVTLIAPSGYNYAWNTGASGQAISVDAPGTYSATLFSTSDSCVSLSNSVEITSLEAGEVSVEVEREELLCQGETVTLTASNGANYLWSTGATGPTLEVTTSGSYYVSANADCFDEPVETPVIDITFLSPTTPEVDNVASNGDGTYTISAIGNNLYWYDEAVGGNELGQGNTFLTNDLMGIDATYFVESVEVVGGEAQAGGRLTNSGGGGYTDLTGLIMFDAYEAFTIKQATVYAEEEGDRTIQFFDEFGTLLDSITVPVAIGEQVIDLNFAVPQGINFALGVAENNLYRNNAGVSYPYALGDVGSVTTSAYGPQYYYYFYNIQIEKKKTVCPSDRVEVLIGVSTNDFDSKVSIEVYPNPTDELLYISYASEENSDLQIELLDVLGRTVWTKTVNSFESKNSESIDVSNFATGVYQLNVSSGDAQRTFKVMVE